MSRIILRWLAIVLVVLSALYILWLRFSDPDMTGVRWFITYWKEIAIYLTVVIIGTYLHTTQPTAKS